MKKSTITTFPCKDSFLSDLEQLPTSGKFWLAYSGGMDSSVLLHLFYSNKNKITQDIEVIYVNHGLQKEADDWGQFCEKQCKEYLIPFRQLKIADNCPKGKSTEEWAREKRYSLIKEIMNENDVLFTAHHQDDQVETFFLQALRGAGPRGLASMPLVNKHADTFHARPLLKYSRESLRFYAEENKLDWQEDKSNLDDCYDRNYFRLKLSPLIKARWPAYRETIDRLINNQKECKVLLDEVAFNDMQLAQLEDRNNLDIDVVKKLSAERQKNFLFFWIKEMNLKTPGSRNIEKIISDIIFSTIEKSPCVNWKNVEVRRYKSTLYALERLMEHDINIEHKWSPEDVLNLLDETLVAKSEQGKGISKLKSNNADFVIRYRQGGEKIQPDGSSHSTTVKQLFQERGVLPWLRDRIPLVYINGELAVIPGFCIDKKYSAEKGESSWDIHWSGYKKAIQ